MKDKICIVTLEVSSLLSEEDTSKKVIEGISMGIQMTEIPEVLKVQTFYIGFRSTKSRFKLLLDKVLTWKR